jgi:hypothetical protein
VPFTSVGEYLHKLRALTECTERAEAGAGGGGGEGKAVVPAPVGRSVILLAAAVSDFYVPEEELSEHKIQSDGDGDGAGDGAGAGGAGGLVLRLRPVPKTLFALRTQWAPSACIVSFKLETDPGILIKKAWGAVEAYGVDAVVANVLETRYSEVTMVRRPGGGGEGEGDGDGGRGGAAGGGGGASPPRRIRIHDDGAVLIDAVVPVRSALGTSSAATTVIAAPEAASGAPGTATGPSSSSSSASTTASVGQAQPLEDALVGEIVALHAEHMRRKGAEAGLK